MDKRPYAERMAHDLKVPLVRLVEGVGRQCAGCEDAGRHLRADRPRLGVLGGQPVAGAGRVGGDGLAGRAAGDRGHCCALLRHGEGTRSQVFVAGPPLVKAASGVDIDKESLGGWQEATRSGSVDAAVDTEDEALALLRRVLGYLPSNVWQLPPWAEPSDDADRTDPALRSLVPRAPGPSTCAGCSPASPTRGRSPRSPPAHARATVVALARLDGRPVVFLGTDSRIDGGGLSADGGRQGCALRRSRRHVPPPGRGVHGPSRPADRPRRRTGRHRCGPAVGRCPPSTRPTSPWASVIVRRAYGAAGATHRNPTRHTFRVAWPSGEWGSLPAAGRGRRRLPAGDRGGRGPAAKRAELQREYEQMTSPFRTAEMFGVEDIIDPAGDAAPTVPLDQQRLPHDGVGPGRAVRSHLPALTRGHRTRPGRRPTLPAMRFSVLGNIDYHEEVHGSTVSRY